jgi:hypothetical protein
MYEGLVLTESSWSWRRAKLRLNDFAVRPFVFDFTNSACEMSPLSLPILVTS